MSANQMMNQMMVSRKRESANQMMNQMTDQRSPENSNKIPKVALGWAFLFSKDNCMLSSLKERQNKKREQLHLYIKSVSNWHYKVPTKPREEQQDTKGRSW